MAPKRQRIRTLIPKLPLGNFSPGPLNSITDVPGVRVSTLEIDKDAVEGEHGIIHTGITAILPRRNIYEMACHAATFDFNGSGELTGSHFLNETGLLAGPIILTGTFGIGAAHEGLCRHYVRENKDNQSKVLGATLPIVAETFDGFLSDMAAFAVRPEHISHALDAVTSDLVKEGCAGGGNGMRCHGFKAGTGTASRKIPVPKDWSGDETEFTVGVLVQANYGGMKDLRVGGVPVGRRFAQEKAVPIIQQSTNPTRDGSIIMVIATDAPILPLQLHRLAKRATIGLGRVGGYGSNYSGDIFLAFSTALEIPIVEQEGNPTPGREIPRVLLDLDLNSFFEAVPDAVEEAIYNALCMATTMQGPLGVLEAINLEKLKRWVEPHLMEEPEL